MDPLTLRQKYPKFTYDKYDYEFSDNNLNIKFYFSLSTEHRFIHQLSISNCSNTENIDNFIFHIGLTLIPSYWKLTCSPTIEISAGFLDPDQISFVHKLIIKGMGEYFYKNQIDFIYPNFLSITSSGNRMPTNDYRMPTNNQILIPMGGGKDSIVTLELLKTNFTAIPFVINPVPVMTDVITTAGLTNYISVASILDPHLLELNSQGYLNGHVPITSFYGMVAVTAAALYKIPFIAFSNERSSNEGNTEYLNQIINHQYAKTLEFETDFHNYIQKYLSPDINYFSFLRPVYDLQIAKIFCTFPHYFPVFSSCNTNFKLIKPENRWCTKCAKCVSTALLLASWIGKDQVVKIMGVFPPDLIENRFLMDELLGKSPIKPFDCVLTREEANLAVDIITHGSSDKIVMFLGSWLTNPNMPEAFSQILKTYVST